MHHKPPEDNLHPAPGSAPTTVAFKPRFHYISRQTGPTECSRKRVHHRLHIDEPWRGVRPACRTPGDSGLNCLILSPPVHQPSEPPAGAYLLAGALAARGIAAPMLDLSLEFFHYAMEQSGMNTKPALKYMTAPPEGVYDTHRHAGHSGVIASALRSFAASFPGWSLTPMDCSPPRGLHRILDTPVSGTPFSAFLDRVLDPVLEKHGTPLVLVSTAYLSQLPATVELAAFLRRRSLRFLVGGSVFNSLSSTGGGLELVRRVIPEVVAHDGSDLMPDGKPVLDSITHPVLLSGRPYLSPAPVIPAAFTTGCIWNRCLFCPDRARPFRYLPEDTLRDFIASAPRESMIHFVDSTIPAHRLPGVLEALRRNRARFFGFARATGEYLAPGFLDALAASGCSMLQWGLESGSREILRRFHKGTDPDTAKKVLREAGGRGIRNYVYLLFGLPGETGDDREETLRMIREIGRDVDFLNASVFNLPLECELVRRRGEFGMELGEYDAGSDVIRLYSPFVCDGRDPRREAKGFLRGEFGKDPAVSRILRNTPKWFRAAHMAFMGPDSPR